jgi:plastocyanin
LLKTILLIFAFAATTQAGDIQGTLQIERKLTKRKVTPTAGLYQRGVSVELGDDAVKDPLAWERSHVVVYIEGDLRSAATSTTAATASIEQKDRQFFPDLVTIPAGSSVSFPNFDPIFHNVFSLSKPKSFDLGNYPKGQSKSVMFPKAGTVFVYCHLHPNMSATIVVTPNKWSTIANADGQFSLKDLPPGKYTIVAWHKTAGAFKQTIDVSDAAPAHVHFVIPFVDEEPAKVAHH